MPVGFVRGVQHRKEHVHVISADCSNYWCLLSAGSCQHKSESAVKFTGKSCKIQKEVGFSKNTVQGGANEIVPIDLSKLTMTTDDDSSSAAANATATAGK